MTSERIGSGPETPVSSTGHFQRGTAQSARARFQRLWPSSTAANRTLGDTGILNVQVWLTRTALRPAAAWAALAGLLAGGVLAGSLTVLWPQVVLLLLLVDPLWGSVWRLAAGRAELLPLPDNGVHKGAEPAQISLPYLQPGSPAARLLDRNTKRVVPVLFRVAFPSVLLALFVATALGAVAVAFTGVLVLVTGAGWISTRRIHRVPVFLHSVVSMALPWLLATWLVSATANESIAASQVVLPMFWLLHQWGIGRCIRFVDERFGLLVLGIADIGIGLVLIWALSPLWLVLWLVFTLPTWLLVYRQQPLRRAEVWQLCAMFASAAGVAQSL